jgi:hypothetical protein
MFPAITADPLSTLAIEIVYFLNFPAAIEQDDHLKQDKAAGFLQRGSVVNRWQL